MVKNSPIHGKGLFAAEQILKDEIVAVKGGYIFNRDELEKIEEKLGPAEIQIGENLYIGPKNEKERNGALLYLNHSCEPNIGIQGQITFVAMRNIDAGEELTHDWARTDFDDYEMICSCGAKQCRGIITGRDWQKKELQKKYKGYFTWYLQKKIDDSLQALMFD